MRKLPFMRLVREIAKRITGREYRWQLAGLQCLQEAAETYLVTMFEAANLCAIHSKRVTVQVKDVKLVKNLAKMNLNGMGQTDDENEH